MTLSSAILMFLAQSSGTAAGALLLPVMLMLGIAYFILMLSKQRRHMTWQTMLDALKTGDRVSTSMPGRGRGEARKQARLDRIHPGSDIKGGTHLILQVMVNDAVNAETDVTIDRLKETLTKANVRYADIAKPDPANNPGRIEI